VPVNPTAASLCLNDTSARPHVCLNRAPHFVLVFSGPVLLLGLHLSVVSAPHLLTFQVAVCIIRSQFISPTLIDHTSRMVTLLYRTLVLAAKLCLLPKGESSWVYLKGGGKWLLPGCYGSTSQH